MELSDLKCINEDVNLDEYINFKENVRKNMNHPEWLNKKYKK